MSEPRFNTDCAIFISRLEKALTTNLFETMIQKNADVISSVVDCGYRYNNGVNIPNEISKLLIDFPVLIRYLHMKEIVLSYGLSYSSKTFKTIFRLFLHHFIQNVIVRKICPITASCVID